ncbi:hypothetical protein [Sphingobium sp.]|uniref:hypothetical protein n=1 Tax=Sphingobium sp. TaxID=1912891 RepID=UPI0028BDE8B0|nr:hypothetical protein [Sphingobium sp.]
MVGMAATPSMEKREKRINLGRFMLDQIAQSPPRSNSKIAEKMMQHVVHHPAYVSPATAGRAFCLDQFGCFDT